MLEGQRYQPPPVRDLTRESNLRPFGAWVPLARAGLKDMYIIVFVWTETTSLHRSKYSKSQKGTKGKWDCGPGPSQPSAPHAERKGELRRLSVSDLWLPVCRRLAGGLSGQKLAPRRRALPWKSTVPEISQRLPPPWGGTALDFSRLSTEVCLRL